MNRCENLLSTEPNTHKRWCQSFMFTNNNCELKMSPLFDTRSVVWRLKQTKIQMRQTKRGIQTHSKTAEVKTRPEVGRRWNQYKLPHRTRTFKLSLGETGELGSSWQDGTRPIWFPDYKSKSFACTLSRGHLVTDKTFTYILLDTMSATIHNNEPGSPPGVWSQYRS